MPSEMHTPPELTEPRSLQCMMGKTDQLRTNGEGFEDAAEYHSHRGGGKTKRTLLCLFTFSSSG